MRFRYAKRKYLIDCSDDEVLRKKDVDKVLPRIIARIPPRSVVTLNRIIAETGYPYYSHHAIKHLVERLKNLGFKVKKVSKRRYIVMRDLRG